MLAHHRVRTTPSRVPSGLVLTLCLALTGCGDKDSTEAPAAQTAAKPSAGSPPPAAAPATQPAVNAAPVLDPAAAAEAALSARRASFLSEADFAGSVSYALELERPIRLGGLEVDLLFDRARFKAGDFEKGEPIKDALCVPNPEHDQGLKVGCVILPTNIAELTGRVAVLSIHFRERAPRTEELQLKAMVIDEFAQVSTVGLKLVAVD